MRIWSIHPKFLDAKGLVALWRETLLAKNVLEGNTKGYKNHPQLLRFKKAENPLEAIHFYLQHVWLEADSRGYHFSKDKFEAVSSIHLINVSRGQMDFERQHLLQKLKIRDPKRYDDIKKDVVFEPHPLFNLIEGDIELWEKR